jgi:hypothetical protein
MSEINKEDAKKFLKMVLETLKSMETELAVHQHVVRGLKNQFSDLDECLKMLRGNADILRAMDEKYDAILKSWVQNLDQMKSVSKFLRDWKPKDALIQ